MSSSQQFAQAVLKYTMWTLLVAVVPIVMVALWQSSTTTTPTGIQGRLISPQEQGVTPAARYTAAQVAKGLSVPPKTDVILLIPAGTSIPREVFFGGPDIDQRVPYYAWCGSKQSGGFTAQYYVSPAAIKTNPLPLSDMMNATPQLSQITGGQTCYVFIMSDTPLPVSSEVDPVTGFNVERVSLLGTDPNNPTTGYIRQIVDPSLQLYYRAPRAPNDPGAPEGCSGNYKCN